MSSLWGKHRGLIDSAVSATRSRGYWTRYQESPSSKIHGAEARPRAEQRFLEQLGRPFDLDQPGATRYVPPEVSPYSREPLGIDYPRSPVGNLISASTAALPGWSEVVPEERVGVCAEILEQLSRLTFENAFATMHTTGQSFMMAFAGSGANSLDRGLEALAHAHAAMSEVPRSARFERSFGRSKVVLDKRYRLRPRGVAAVIACASYPAWNVYPALMANLATGNPVILKPHPECILPVAMTAQVARGVLTDHGHDPDLVTVAIDTPEQPVAEALAVNPAIAIIDFTGSQRFGSWLERHYVRELYTETSGCNAVVLHSARDLDAVIRSITHGMALFSAQMCTAPQNVWISKHGVDTPGGRVPADEVTERISRQLDRWCDEDHAAAVCGAVQSERTLAAISRLEEAAEKGAAVARPSAPYRHPSYPGARTATPLVVRCSADQHDLFGREHFGPMAFVITAPSADEALAGAGADAKAHGSISSYVYADDEQFLAKAEATFWRAGASISCNLIRHMPIGYAAAFSDYHVTGLSPAGNACLTDRAFVASRFRIVQSKTEVAELPTQGG